MFMGWVKLHRELMTKAIWQCSKPEQKVVLITILMLANHKDNQWLWQGEKFICHPGQFVTSISSLAELAGVSIRSVRTAINNFQKLEFLTNKTTKKGRIITVCNWDKYQSFEEETDKQNDKQPTNNRQTKRQLTRNKNERKKEFKTEEDKNLFNELKLVFIEKYRQLKSTEYYFTAKDAGQLQQIQNKLKVLNRNNNENLREIWEYILDNLSGWVLDNLSIPILNSKFNEIVAQAKNKGGRTEHYDIDEILKGISK